MIANKLYVLGGSNNDIDHLYVHTYIYVCVYASKWVSE